VVSSFPQLMAAQAQAAVKVLGAHHSSWNKSYELLAMDDKRRGLVRWDHTIEYHPQHVVATLQEMFDRAGQRHEDDTLRRYREALRVVFHENIHLLAAAGTSYGMAVDAYQEPANKVLEEATTELATQEALDAYINELDLEAIAPGITSVRTGRAYGQYIPAVEVFGEAVADSAKLSAREVIRQLAVVNPENKFRVAAQLLYDANQLSEVVPEAAKAAALERIEAAIRPPFAKIRDFDPDDPLDVRMSALAGTRASLDADAEVREIAAYWAANQDLRRTLDAGLGAIPPLQKPQYGAPNHEPHPKDPGATGRPDRTPHTLGD
jgi:hypothetical protein